MVQFYSGYKVLQEGTKWYRGNYWYTELKNTENSDMQWIYWIHFFNDLKSWILTNFKNQKMLFFLAGCLPLQAAARVVNVYLYRGTETIRRSAASWVAHQEATGALGKRPHSKSVSFPVSVSVSVSVLVSVWVSIPVSVSFSVFAFVWVSVWVSVPVWVWVSVWVSVSVFL